jgi:hypothetical protein
MFTILYYKITLKFQNVVYIVLKYYIIMNSLLKNLTNREYKIIN